MGYAIDHDDDAARWDVRYLCGRLRRLSRVEALALHGVEGDVGALESLDGDSAVRCINVRIEFGIVATDRGIAAVEDMVLAKRPNRIFGADDAIVDHADDVHIVVEGEEWFAIGIEHIVEANAVLSEIVVVPE